MYGNTYLISTSKITKLNEKNIQFKPNGFRKIKYENDQLIVKDDREVLNLKDSKIKYFEIYSNLALFILRLDNIKDEIVCFNLESKKELWRTSLVTEEKRIQQLLFVVEGYVYIIGYNGELNRVSVENGKLDMNYRLFSNSKVSDIPIGKLESKTNWFVNPKIEFNVKEEIFYSRKLEGGILDNGTKRIELYYDVLDYTFDENKIYFQIHSYPDQHNKKNTSQILMLKRGSDIIESRFNVNPTKKSVDAKSLILINDHIIILDSQGHLMKKRIEYGT
jgi:outer membrane protein assembly factor BamB